MNKNQFIKFLNDNTSELSLDEKIALLKKMKEVWIPSIISNKTKNYTMCTICKKLIKNSDFKKISEIKTFNECVFKDAGYGDDDEYGDVSYKIIYSICPNCNHKEQVTKYYLKTSNVHKRWG